MWLCATVVCNTSQNSSDYLSSYYLDKVTSLFRCCLYYRRDRRGRSALQDNRHEVSVPVYRTAFDLINDNQVKKTYNVAPCTAKVLTLLASTADSRWIFCTFRHSDTFSAIQAVTRLCEWLRCRNLLCYIRTIHSKITI